jgi:hypothetical protein
MGASLICHACHRTLRNQPVMVGGKPFGPVCGAKARTLPAEDLFGFNPDVFAQERGAKLGIELRQEFAALRRRRMEALA